MYNSQLSTTVMNLVSSQRPSVEWRVTTSPCPVPSARHVPPRARGPQQEPTGPGTRRALLEDLECPKFELGIL